MSEPSYFEYTQLSGAEALRIGRADLPRGGGTGVEVSLRHDETMIAYRMTAAMARDIAWVLLEFADGADGRGHRALSAV